MSVRARDAAVETDSMIRGLRAQLVLLSGSGRCRRRGGHRGLLVRLFLTLGFRAWLQFALRLRSPLHVDLAAEPGAFGNGDPR